MQNKPDVLNKSMEQLIRENSLLAAENEISKQSIISLSGENSDLQLENADLKRKIQNLKRGVR
ncbi:hypothetical protein [Carnobacterium maltaromaticum]|uniref:hypothetical protein n=1 Tax=Carnobacterium maltaromaticum TaxID=2751 RepID=UPI0012F8E86A|nr:hypothetical protein [Carnobacterium maltaromaticum]